MGEDKKDILNIWVSQIDATASICVGLEFRGEENGETHNLDDHAFTNIDPYGRSQGLWIPSIPEPENTRINRHQIDCDTVYEPAADRVSAFPTIAKTQSSQPCFKFRKLYVGGYRHYEIHVIRWPKFWGTFRHQEKPRAATDKDDLVKQLPQFVGYFQDGQTTQTIPSCSSWAIMSPANFRSLARPERRASTSANRRCSLGSLEAAIGADR